MFQWHECQNIISHVQLFAIPWTVVYQASLSMGFSRQEYWCGLPFPSPGDLPDPGIESRSPALQANAFTVWTTSDWVTNDWIILDYWCFSLWASLVAQMIKNLPAIQETKVGSLGREDPLKKRMATHPSFFAWRIPWTEEPGRLQTMRLQRVGY